MIIWRDRLGTLDEFAAAVERMVPEGEPILLPADHNGDRSREALRPEGQPDDRAAA